MRKSLAAMFLVVVTLLLFGSAHGEYAFTTISFPGALGTTVNGISGGNVVGTSWRLATSGSFYYSWNDFLYNGGTYSILSIPGSPGTSPGDRAYGISGSNIVGTYGSNSGFLFSGGTETILNVPGAAWTEAHGVSGTTVVGYYYTDTYHSFEYNNGNYATFNAPFASHGTLASGISGSTIVGSYLDANLESQGFIDNAGVFTILSVPGARETYAAGVSGGVVVGTYVGQDGQDHGFIYNGTNYTTINVPGATFTEVSGIDGSTIVGSAYYGPNGNGVYEGFVAAPEPVPVPGAILLFVPGMAGLVALKRKFVR